MAVAQLVTPIVQPDVEKKLKFEFDTTEELDVLKVMLNPPSDVAESYQLPDQPITDINNKKEGQSKPTKSSATNKVKTYNN